MESGTEPAPDQPGSATLDEASQIAVAAAVPEATGEPEATGAPDLRQESVPQASAVNAEPPLRRQTVQEYGSEKYVAAEFPRRALRRGITGAVDVRFVINTDGSSDMIRVLESERGDIFSDSAIDAVRQWRFAPREEAIQARITLRFDMTP